MLCGLPSCIFCLSYILSEDGFHRLQTVRYESVELQPSSGEAADDDTDDVAAEVETALQAEGSTTAQTTTATAATVSEQEARTEDGAAVAQEQHASIEEITAWMTDDTSAPASGNATQSNEYASNLQLLGDVAVLELSRQSPAKAQSPGSTEFSNSEASSHKRKLAEAFEDTAEDDVTVDKCRIVLDDGRSVTVNAAIPTSLLGLAERLDQLDSVS